MRADIPAGCAVPSSNRLYLSNIRALLPSASSGRAGVAGANNRRSKEDVLPYYLVIYYLLQKYNFSVVIQNYLVYIIIKMRGLCLKYLKNAHRKGADCI